MALAALAAPIVAVDHVLLYETHTMYGGGGTACM